MRKSLLLVLLIVCAPIVVQAQSVGKAQRGMQRLEFTIDKSTKPSASGQLPAKPLEASFEVTVPESAFIIEPNAAWDSTLSIHGEIVNLTNEPLNLGFIRRQEIPYQWRSSVCFGFNCFPEATNAAIEPLAWAPNSSRELVLNMTMPPSAQDSAVIRVVIYSPAHGDSVHLTYRGVMLPIAPVECRVFKFSNPYADRIRVSNVSISNTEDFNLKVLTDLEYAVRVGEGINAQFCLKNFDGKPYTTDITFVTDSGSFTRTVTMTAPDNAGVAPSKDLSKGLRIAGVSPNPASASQQLAINIESSRNAEATFVIADLLGRELMVSSQSIGIGESTTKLSLSSLPAGGYLLLLREGGNVIDQTSFNISR